MRKTIRKIIEKDVNPNVEEWEETEQFPAHKVFKQFAQAGLLGITRDPGKFCYPFFQRTLI